MPQQPHALSGLINLKGEKMLLFKKLKTLFSVSTFDKPPKLPDNINIKLSDTDDEFGTTIDESNNAPDDDLGFAEGQTFIIEYCDAYKNVTMRRITAYNIRRNSNGIPLIVAKCHERNADRSFRIDRIVGVYDMDGVNVSSVKQFLIDDFGMAPQFAEMAEPHQPKRALAKTNNITAAKHVVRSQGVHLLWCFANADGDFDPRELDVIIDYCEQCCLEKNLHLSESDRADLAKYIKSLRPTSHTVDKSISDMGRANNTSLNRFLKYCVLIAKADGHIHPDEITAINTISNEIVGYDIL